MWLMFLTGISMILSPFLLITYGVGIYESNKRRKQNNRIN
jgi:hypothetical protein